MIEKHDPIPAVRPPRIFQADGESLGELFDEVFSLSQKVASRITSDEVDDRLREVLRRSARPAEAEDTHGLGDTFHSEDLAPFEAVTAQAPGPDRLEARLREVKLLVLGTRRELVSMTDEALQTLALARNAYQQAEKTRCAAVASYADTMTTQAEAARIVKEAHAWNDAALERAAVIIRNAKAAADSTRSEIAAMTAKAQRRLDLADAAYAEAKDNQKATAQAYDEARTLLTEVRELHHSALERAASIVRDAVGAAGDIVRGTQEAAAVQSGAPAEIPATTWGPPLIAGAGGAGKSVLALMLPAALAAELGSSSPDTEPDQLGGEDAQDLKPGRHRLSAEPRGFYLLDDSFVGTVADFCRVKPGVRPVVVYVANGGSGSSAGCEHDQPAPAGGTHDYRGLPAPSMDPPSPPALPSRGKDSTAVPAIPSWR
jgi:hypothetical protein